MNSMYEIAVRIRHDCPYLKISNLFDSEIISYCSDYYDLMVIPNTITKEAMEYIKAHIDDPDSLEIKSPDSQENSYVYFKCMCSVETSVSPKIQARGGIVEHPIVYRNGWEYYKIICINEKTQAEVLAYLQTINEFELISIRNLGLNGIFKSQYISVHQLMLEMTDRQIEVIAKAYEEGYYTIPRQVKTEELAADFGVSRAATEKSLRKAENTVMDIVLPYILFRNKMIHTNHNTSSLDLAHT